MVAEIFHITNVYGVTAGWVGCAGYVVGCAGYVVGCAGYVVGCAGYVVGNYPENNATFVAHLAS